MGSWKIPKKLDIAYVGLGLASGLSLLLLAESHYILTFLCVIAAWLLLALLRKNI